MSDKFDEPVKVGRLLLFVHRSLDWSLGHIRTISIMVLCALCLTFFAFQIMARYRSSVRADYALANKIYSEFATNPAKGAQFLPEIAKLLKSYPELHQRFDPLLVRYHTSNKSNVDGLSKSLFARVAVKTPYYAQFSEISLLIDQGLLKDALEKSINLKQVMITDDNFWKSQKKATEHGGLLYSFNLLRIALLYESLGLSREEFLAWNDLKKYVGWADESKEEMRKVAAFLNDNFKDKNISLRDYIKNREDILNKP